MTSPDRIKLQWYRIAVNEPSGSSIYKNDNYFRDSNRARIVRSFPCTSSGFLTKTEKSKGKDVTYSPFLVSRQYVDDLG